ncbi:DMT family transporter [Candidatus Pelagibacter communis]|uniref:DMT family transporter n=1 Tax=Pelagibacter ubique TaxID=198252 RepID=UPI00094C2843|nr:DMT family transporter [Candidatus Pelagibacter ubique]
MFTRNQLGVLYGIASVACFAMMDASVKWLDMFPVGQVLFSRFFFGLIPILMLVPRSEFKTFYKTSRPKLHAFRAITGTLAIIALFIALREIPLADVVSLTFGGPIFVTLGSIFFLSEKVGIKRWLAVLIGFFGMLLIVKPAYEELNIYYIFPIIFCIFFACVALSIRSLSSTEPNYRIALYFSLLSMIVGLLTLPFGWVMPNKFELFLLIFTGLVGSVANILLTVSLRYAEASLVTPTKYLNLVFAILLGYFIWSEIPKLLTIVGAGLIIISSVIIFMRESELKKKVVSSRP